MVKSNFRRSMESEQTLGLIQKRLHNFHVHICCKYKYIAFSSMPKRVNWHTQACKSVDHISNVFGKRCKHYCTVVPISVSEFTHFLLFPPLLALCECLCHLLWQPMYRVLNEQTDLILSPSKWHKVQTINLKDWIWKTNHNCVQCEHRLKASKANNCFYSFTI